MDFQGGNGEILGHASSKFSPTMMEKEHSRASQFFSELSIHTSGDRQADCRMKQMYRIEGSQQRFKDVGYENLERHILYIMSHMRFGVALRTRHFFLGMLSLWKRNTCLSQASDWVWGWNVFGPKASTYYIQPHKKGPKQTSHYSDQAK